MFLDGRPPVALGVTSGGDFFGGTQISFTDVLGDQQFNLFAASVSQYRTMSLSYLNLERRHAVGAAGLLADAVLLRPARRPLLRPGVQRPDRSRSRRGDAHDAAAARRSPSTRSTATAASRCTAAWSTIASSSTTRASRPTRSSISRRSSGRCSSTTARWCRSASRSSRRRRSSASSDRSPAARCASTTRTRRRSAARSRARPSTSTRASTSGSAAAACSRCAREGFKSWGTNPGFLYFGGNSEMRGYDYLSFVGQDAFYLNAELRFPLIDAMATPIGILGGIRGTLFANIGGAQLRRRVVQGLDEQHDGRDADHRLPSGRPGARADLRRRRVSIDGFRLRRRPRLIRRQPPDLRARLPGPLRLVVEDALQQATGKTSSSRRPAAARSSARRSSRCGSATTFRRSTLR